MQESSNSKLPDFYRAHCVLGICTLRLNGPPVNALDGDMLDTAVKVIKIAESTKDVRGIILTSNLHGKIFSAGLNLMDLYKK